MSKTEKEKAAEKAKKAQAAAARKASLAAMSPQEKKVALAKERAEKFVKLGPKFVNRALASLAKVSTLAKRGSYTYTDEQAAKVVKALRDRVDSIEKAFAGGATSDSFTL